MLETIFDIMMRIFSVVGFATVAICISIEIDKWKKEFRKRKCKIRCLCKHEYVKRVTWTHFEHEYEKKSIYREIELQCRQCGKKKTIKIYEDEVD